jgi:hypothetical protein
MAVHDYLGYDQGIWIGWIMGAIYFFFINWFFTKLGLY